MLILFIVILFSFCNATIEKRALVYPVGGTYKVITAIAIPIEIGTKQALSYSINFQFQYVLPQNFSQLSQNDEWFTEVSTKRRKRNKRVLETISQQKILYMTIERELNRHGFDGRHCLRNIICELSSSDSNYYDTLYNQLAHILLIPRSEIIQDVDYEDFKDAMEAGKYGVDCNSIN
ncbi:uncharacterized protein LOC123301027 [Chrysoperla carnea]|uniref:uncharacterized protein LOC123301027 n=1 Tax=Chrysoperla carnea TaxID=189513 RepID=UPI001D08C71F|nr:uncharacterized protein LOC123301027 [Chrysoperla carnea]